MQVVYRIAKKDKKTEEEEGRKTAINVVGRIFFKYQILYYFFNNFS